MKRNDPPLTEPSVIRSISQIQTRQKQLFFQAPSVETAHKNDDVAAADALVHDQLYKSLELAIEGFQFGPYPTTLGTPKKDKTYVTEATGFYLGSGDDVITSGSFPVFDESFPGGYLVNPVVMSGSAGDGIYKFKLSVFRWCFVADAGGGKGLLLLVNAIN